MHMPEYYLRSHFDPVRQLAWTTSKWARRVGIRDYRVERRLTSLQMVNEHNFEPPGGRGPVGPVIRRVPGQREATELWDRVAGPAGLAGSSEFKRRLRERPQLPALSFSRYGTIDRLGRR
jgi:hypothetical protein